MSRPAVMNKWKYEFTMEELNIFFPSPPAAYMYDDEVEKGV